MKRKNIFAGISKALLMIILIFSVNILSYGVENLVVEPYEIFFNCETGNTNDALSTCDDTGTPVISSEWDDFDGEKYKFAYIKGQSNRRIKVSFQANDYTYTGTMHLLIKLSYGPGGTDGIGTVCNYFVPNYKCTGTALCNNSSDHTITLNLTGQLPPSVGKHRFKWKWDIYAIPVNNPNYCAFRDTTTTFHTYYTLLAAPQAPMAQPWSSVLEKACTWAGGQTTSSGIAQTVVQGLYNNSGFLYDVIDGSSRYTGQQGTSFNLNTMLSEIGGTDIPVNCYDMGKAVTIFINALGCVSSYAFSNPFSYVNCIKPIGRGWTNNPFYEYGYPYNTLTIVGEDDSESTKPLGRSRFYNHAFCILDNIIYDACLKVDTDSNPDAPTHIESWAIGWDWANYKSKVIDNNPVPPLINYPQPYSFTVY